MGDAHLIAINDCTIDDDDEEASCDQYVALIVAQHHNKFDFTALDSGKSMICFYPRLNIQLPFFSVSFEKFGKNCKRTESICSFTSYWCWFQR